MNEMQNKSEITDERSRNITLNRLPARTWNHLKMNEVVVPEIELLLPEDYAEKGIERTDFKLADEGQKEVYSKIETALGKDMDRIGEDFPIAVIYSDIDSTTEETNKNNSDINVEEAAKDNVEKNTEFNTTIALNLTADGHYGRYFLYAKKNSKMNVSFYCHSETGETRPFILQIKIYAEENASISLSVAQTLGKKVRAFCDIGGVLEKGANVDLVKMELGGKEVYAGAYMALKGDESSFAAHIGYLGEEEQHLDMNYIARHYGRKTSSLMESNGVLDSNAFKLFRGTIDFVKGCSGSVGNEKEEVLLLGDEVVNQTIPLILCAEEDVEGNHGASIGELDEKTLFYLMSRGFSKEEARKMIADARLEAIAEKMKENSVKEKTLNYLEGRK